MGVRPDQWPPTREEEYGLGPVDEETATGVRAKLGIGELQVRQKANQSRAITERERRALELLVAGATYDQIAAVLGLRHRGSASQLCARALAKRAVEFRASATYEQARVLLMDRLERLYARYLPVALGSTREAIPPDPKAAEIVLKIMDREARILGLDAPIKVEQEITVTSPQELAARRQEILDSLAEVEERRAAIEGEFTVVA